VFSVTYGALVAKGTACTEVQVSLEFQGEYSKSWSGDSMELCVPM
jgi:hypothetical protein